MRLITVELPGEGEKIRLDKWLWAARFFKTRSLATRAVNGGLVHLNGARVKAARPAAVGDELVITRGELEFTVIILALHDRRGPASLARTLYEETSESISRRESRTARKRLESAAGERIPRRKPDKRERRLIRRFVKGGG